LILVNAAAAKQAGPAPEILPLCTTNTHVHRSALARPHQ
jgi:hypothetical protein